ncbi:MAG: hypothetical protein SP1CHLAM54_07000 [Chlamydiia bacterium]|nr:hypothetical protein [Chlamydiia bacterium]MCH9615606.1 hypothetical protein [Chlamydiia bacterium]MCH9628991.1 hypothetical protein [Chlamydiia bacterium]
MIWVTILIGAVAGYLSGLLGIGGGVIITPALYYLFLKMGLPYDNLMKYAIATSLSSMIISTLSAAIAHKKRGGINTHAFFGLLPGVLVGGVLGAFIATVLPAYVLKLIFAIYAITVGLKMVLHKKHQSGDHRLPSKPILSFCGLIVGTISSLVGVGGGILNVPLLSYFRLKMKQAIGTSSAITFFVALIGALSYVLFGKLDTTHPGMNAWGFVVIPAVLALGISAALTAPLGVKAAHTLSGDQLKRIFGVVIICAGLVLLIP